LNVEAHIVDALALPSLSISPQHQGVIGGWRGS